MRIVKFIVGGLTGVFLWVFSLVQLWGVPRTGELALGGKWAPVRVVTWGEAPLEFSAVFAAYLIVVVALPWLLARRIDWGRLVGRRSIWGNGEPRDRIGRR